MANAELAHQLERIADLLEIDGGDRFRVNSYRAAARALDALTEEVADIEARGELETVKGIGKGMAARIRQYLAGEKIDTLAELESRLPPGLSDLLEISGLGPKKIAALFKELQVVDMPSLKAAIESGRIEELSGFGKASVAKIAEGIAFLEQSAGRTPLGLALPLAEELAATVAEFPGVKRVEIAGSLRRGKETIGDIDILCESDQGEEVVAVFTQLPSVARVLAKGPKKASITIRTPEGRELQIDLRVVPRESFGAALQYFTGSKEHNVRLRERAVKRGWRLNEWGLFDKDEKPLAGEDEKGIYRKLGVPCVTPTLREDHGEVDPDYSADDLIALSDIKGDLHMHTVASDGRNSIEEMAAAAKALGYDYIAICDHSPSAVIANGLSPERLLTHVEAIRAAEKRVKGIRILAGAECDILPDGRLDYPNEILAQLDWVVASIHLAMGKGGKDKLSPTERTLAAIENPHIRCIGHPTGRLILKREAMELDMAKVVEAAARAGTFLEINAAWQRLDLCDRHARQALEAGVTLVINTDAHSTEGLKAMRYGILTAQRAGAKKGQVLNTLGKTEFLKKIKP